MGIIDREGIENVTDATPRAGRQEWIGLAVLALACVVYAMDLTVLELAVPALSADLRPSSSQLLWILDIYGFFVAGLLVPMGTLGDRIGRRKLLMIGAGTFAVVSIFAAFTTSAAMLIVARAVLGIAGATLAPSTLSLIRSMFLNSAQRTTAIGVWITAFSVGGAIGPLLGGVLLAHFWWGSIFLLGVPVMLLLLVLGPVLLPEFRDPAAGRLDLQSAALSLTAVLAVIYGLKRLAQDGLGWLPALSVVVGLVVGIVFLRRQRTLTDPMIDLQLFRVPTFSMALATYTLSIFAFFGASFFIAQYLQLVLGLSPLQAGLWMLPSSGGFILGSLLAPMVVRRVRPAFVMGVGLIIAAVGFGVLTQVDGPHGLAVIVTGSLISALGLAPIFTLATDLIVGSAPPERAGAAAAISETGAELGGALGLAILGSLGAAIYRHVMADANLDGVMPEAMAAARSTLGGATAAAVQLPGQLGVELLDAARVAFAQGFQVVALTSAVMMAIMAVLAAMLLRRVGAASEEQSARQPERAAHGSTADTPERESAAAE